MKSLIFVVAVVAFATITIDSFMLPPLQLSIFYESFCPDSKSFIMNQLHPNFCKAQEYLNLTLVPFGKADSSSEGFTCQHGPKECRGNTIHNCVLSLIQDPKVQVDYVNCAMYNPDQPERIEKTCVEEFGVDVELVEKCFTSINGYQLMLKAEQFTKAMTPGPQFVPTIVFNDEYNDDDQNEAYLAFESTLCKKLENHGFTAVCSDGMLTSPDIC